jgi:hypothetical protein
VGYAAWNVQIIVDGFYASPLGGDRYLLQFSAEQLV